MNKIDGMKYEINLLLPVSIMFILSRSLLYMFGQDEQD
jgi:hypothetical protein